MKNLQEILGEIEAASNREDIRRAIMTCGATHLAQDPNGLVFAYKGKPSRENDFDEWMSEGESGVMLFCAELDRPADWTQCVWELP